jgi:hypothetical protein
MSVEQMQVGTIASRRVRITPLWIGLLVLVAIGIIAGLAVNLPADKATTSIADGRTADFSLESVGHARALNQPASLTADFSLESVGHARALNQPASQTAGFSLESVGHARSLNRPAATVAVPGPVLNLENVLQTRALNEVEAPSDHGAGHYSAMAEAYEDHQTSTPRYELPYRAPGR